MNNLRDYFSDARDEANDNFFSYSGGFDNNVEFADEFSNFGGDDPFANASGGVSAPTSQPYIVVVKNTNTTTSTPATILGAYTTLQTTGPNYQNSASISISMGISGITYPEFLYQSMNKPFVTGLTYYQSSSQAQVLETLSLIQKDVNGNESQMTLVPTVDPYQNQNTIVAIRFTYQIDGFTAVVISSVLAGTTVKVYFYPAETSSIANPLTGRRAVDVYGNPGIEQGQKVQLSSQAVRALSGGM